MRLASLLLLSAAVSHAAPSLEGLRAESALSFGALPRFQAFKSEPPRALPEDGPGVELLDPRPTPVDKASALGAVIGRVNLPAQLDRHRDLLTRQLGASNWNISVAGDAGFNDYFLTFQQGERLVIAPLGDLNRLRGSGINATVEPGVIYNFKVSINIFNPVRGSTLEITPVQGTKGPGHKVKTGVVLDAVKARSYVFSDGVEYWFLHGTDVDAKTNTLTSTKSFLFIHENGTSSKAWPMAESAVPVGQPTAVDFEGKKLVLERSAAGELFIRK